MLEVQTKRHGITYEDVAKAADTLHARAERPTINSVRNLLGTGSSTTIHKHLGQWQASRREVAQTAIALPVELQRLLLQEIETQVEGTRRRLEGELEAAKADRDVLAEENALLQQQSEELQKRSEMERDAQKIASEKDGQEIARIMGLKEQLNSELGLARQEIEKHRQDSDKARSSLARAEFQLESMPRLLGEQDRLQAELKIEIAARHKAERELAIAETKIGELLGFKSDAEKLSLSLNELKETNSNCQAKTSGLAAELEAAKAREEDLRRYRDEAEALRRELSTAKDQHIKDLNTVGNSKK